VDDTGSWREAQFWFERADGVSIKLPRGWFGRPYDNMHKLTWSIQRPNRILMEFDNQTLLTFTGATTIVIGGSELVVANFQQLVIDWRDYGTSRGMHADIFTEGSVHFALSVGSSIGINA
jgi:hypothetical protein